MRKYHILHIKHPQNKQEENSKCHNNPINRGGQILVEILIPVFSLGKLCLKQESPPQKKLNFFFLGLFRAVFVKNGRYF